MPVPYSTTENTQSIKSTASASQPSATTTAPSSQPADLATKETAQAAAQVGEPTTKTAEEIEADRLYEERIEEEYAKREGGA